MLASIESNLGRSIKNWLPVTPQLFAWNSIIRKCTQSDRPLEAVILFLKLRRMGIPPDNFTYPFVFKACGRCSIVEVGSQVHCLVMKTGLLADRYVGNTLLSMYAECGATGLSRMVFDEMLDRDVVSWSSMIAGYVTCNCHLKAISVFQQMKLARVKPNSVTIVSLLRACTQLGNLRMGQSLHSYAIVNNIKLDVILGTAALEMYSKCGRIEKGIQVFNSMSEKNLKTWTVMICGLANHGRGKDAISLFTQMEKVGIKPDNVSFSGILCACSHLGLVKEGQVYFDRMVNEYNIEPTIEHYGCMVDMFGRAGMLKEAYEIIRNMPREPNSVILRSFLSACKLHGWAHVDDDIKKLLLQVEPSLGSNYVLASNVSAISNGWEDAANMRVMMKERGLKKVPGCSWVK